MYTQSGNWVILRGCNNSFYLLSSRTFSVQNFFCFLYSHRTQNYVTFEEYTT